MKAFVTLLLLSLLYVSLANMTTSENVTSTPEPHTSTIPQSYNTTSASSTMSDTPTPSLSESPPLTTATEPPYPYSVSNISGSYPDNTTNDSEDTTDFSTQGGLSGYTSSGPLPNESSSTTGSPGTATTSPKKPCQDNPCGAGASCVNLYNEYICVCIEGNFYSSGTCQRGKSFLGQITAQVPDPYDLQDESSLTYQDFWKNITTLCKNAFNNTDYKQTVMYTISTPSLQARTVKVAVNLVNIFNENTTENETSVSEKINAEINKRPSNSLTYSSQDQCEYYGCEDTDQDNCGSSSNCQCKAGLHRPYPQSHFCIPLQCSEDCKAENNKQCLKQRTGKLECVCLPGYKMKEASCQKCPFGYSGMNCEDQFQLILTIVGTILGVIVLSLVIALIATMRSTNTKKNMEEQHLIENDFQNLQLRQTGISNLGARGSLFPEVKTEASQGYRSSNPYINQ